MANAYHFWPMALGALAVLLLLSGLDDFVPILICLMHRLFGRNADASPRAPDKLPERRMAIFVPCWKESDVIANMIRHNLAAIRYRQLDFFLGVYPNDAATVDVVQELAKAFGNVHVALCPHAGPTSKADCLNWIWRSMLVWEQEHAARFDTILLHDAEDLIHPEALALIDCERAQYAMVQVPVLPLATPFHEFTHGIYCDDFAESQTIDMPARQFSRSFIPSNGVGTGFAREILERLAGERSGQVFDPASLTEDYEIGVYIHKAGYRQLFAPLQASGNLPLASRMFGKGLIATREFFPRRVRSAVRQRTRWVTGIGLQNWQRYGWSGSWRTRYWFWRDRKGLLANPLSFLTNLLFLAGSIDWAESTVQHRPWAFAVADPAVVSLCWMTFGLQCFRLLLRMACVTRIFGFAFALGVPVRVLHGNFINCCASLSAVWRYTNARFQRRPLPWLKTEHAYPAPAALQPHRRELPEMLASSGHLSEDALSRLKSEVAADADIAEFLTANKLISEDDLCRVLSLHSGLPAAHVDVKRVKKNIVRSLPAHVEKRYGVVPFRVHGGRLFVAGARVPASNLSDELKSFTRLPVEVHLVPKRIYEELRALL